MPHLTAADAAKRLDIEDPLDSGEDGDWLFRLPYPLKERLTFRGRQFERFPTAESLTSIPEARAWASTLRPIVFRELVYATLCQAVVIAYCTGVAASYTVAILDWLGESSSDGRQNLLLLLFLTPLVFGPALVRVFRTSREWEWRYAAYLERIDELVVADLKQSVAASACTCGTPGQQIYYPKSPMSAILGWRRPLRSQAPTRSKNG